MDHQQCRRGAEMLLATRPKVGGAGRLPGTRLKTGWAGTRPKVGGAGRGTRPKMGGVQRLPETRPKVEGAGRLPGTRLMVRGVGTMPRLLEALHPRPLEGHTGQTRHPQTAVNHHHWNLGLQEALTSFITVVLYVSPCSGYQSPRH